MEDKLLTIITSLYRTTDEELNKIKRYYDEINSIPWIEFIILSDNPEMDNHFESILGDRFVKSQKNLGKFKRLLTYIAQDNNVSGKWIQVYDSDDILELEYLNNELRDILSYEDDNVIIKHRYMLDHKKIVTPKRNIVGNYAMLYPTRYMKQIPTNVDRADIWDDVLFISALYNLGCNLKLNKDIHPYYRYIKNNGQSTLDLHSTEEQVEWYISSLEQAALVWKQVNVNKRDKYWLPPYLLMFEKHQVKATSWNTKDNQNRLKNIKHELKHYN